MSGAEKPTQHDATPSSAPPNNDTKEPEKSKNLGFDHFVERRGGTYNPGWWEWYIKGEMKAFGLKKVCEENVLTAIRLNPGVRLLLEALNSAGCPIDIRRHVSCESCVGPVTGGYDQEYNQIVICQNKTRTAKHVQVGLAHELIHMFDNCINKMDFRNPEHVACTEIRAANLAHCSFLSAAHDGSGSFFNIKKAHRDCVRIRAAKSLEVVRDITMEQALEIVDRVFYRCYNDLEPFGRRPRAGSDDLRKAYNEGYYYGYRSSKPAEWTDE